MMLEPPPPPPASDARAVVVAVAIAAMSTFATALATWAADELRAKYGRAPKVAEAPPASKDRS